MSTGRLRPASNGPLAQALAEMVGSRMHVDVTIPRTTVAGRMRLVDRAEAFAIFAEARAFFAEKKISLEPGMLASPGVVEEWNNEIATRHLAVAVRDPSDLDKPLAALDEWRMCDDDQVSALWDKYQDLRAQLDPLGLPDLDDAAIAAIRSAVKKKDADLLRPFGCSALISYLLTTGEQPSA